MAEKLNSEILTRCGNTDRHTDTQTHRHTDTHTDTQTGVKQYFANPLRGEVITQHNTYFNLSTYS